MPIEPPNKTRPSPTEIARQRMLIRRLIEQSGSAESDAAAHPPHEPEVVAFDVLPGEGNVVSIRPRATSEPSAEIIPFPLMPPRH